MPDKLEQISMLFSSGMPLVSALNIKLESVKAAEAEMSLPYDPALIGDPSSGIIHGGPISVLLDSTAGLAVFSHPDCGGPTATINLRIDYMRSARPEARIFAQAKVYHVTRKVAFVRGMAWDNDPEKPIAHATGTFTFVSKSKGKSA
jgi:uncharacterized protein (TIGR00369 family)